MLVKLAEELRLLKLIEADSPTGGGPVTYSVALSDRSE
jgi:hypothetical protein